MKHDQKHLFSLPDDIHYLNCARKAPLLKSCEEAATEALHRERNPIEITTHDFFGEVDEVRSSFGKLINCDSGHVAVIPSVSYGVASALRNIGCKPGQHAITVAEEFPSDYFGLKRWCDGNQAELKIIQPNSELSLKAADWNNRILESINEQTAFVILSSVHWMNGLKFDLKKIGQQCRKVGAKLIVDGTQSVGAMPMDVQLYNIDVLICASYKWLFGPYSIGLAYYGEAFHNGIPIEESWMNRTNSRDFSKLTEYDDSYRPGAQRYNVGETSNFILMPMLNAALTQIHSWTPDYIQEYCKELTNPLFDYLSTLGVQFEPFEYRSNHLFDLPLPASMNAEKLQQKLEEHKIYVSLRGNSVRTSVHLFNTSNDINKLIHVLKETN